jgi:hypothetical protein
MQQVTRQLCEMLKEPPYIQPRVLRVVRWGGIEFAQAVAEEALAVEAEGGMMTLDGSRRRTPGGVFFYLARGRLSKPLRRKVFYFYKRKKKKAATPDQEQEPEQPEPAVKAAAPAEPESMEEVVDPLQQLTTLRQALEDAQQHLEAIRSGPKNKQTGMFSAMKAVVDLQKEIDTLLKEHPDLAEA